MRVAVAHLRDTMDKTRLLIIEEHMAVRQALEVRLRSSARLDLVAPACNLHDGRRQVEEARPDVVLLGFTGNATEELFSLAQDIRDMVRMGVMVIVLASFADDVEREIVLQAGAMRYLLKDINTPQLIAEIEAANPRQRRPHYGSGFSSLTAHSAF